MTRIVAVSGGVDSVVLLDWLVHNSTERIIVVHVDHGIRGDSWHDARFVEALAKKYDVENTTVTLQLGSHASEDNARKARYEVLYAVAAQHDGVIYTAHHADDLVGSVTINLHRGTGWRGLAVMNRRAIERPLLSWRKQDIYRHALEHRLEWVEDATNTSETILRNRLKGAIGRLPDETVQAVSRLRDDQVQLGSQLHAEFTTLLDHFDNRRHPYTHVQPSIACELLRELVGRQAGARPTRPDAERLLLAIKTAHPGTTLQLADGVRVRFTRDKFVVDTTEK